MQKRNKKTNKNIQFFKLKQVKFNMYLFGYSMWKIPQDEWFCGLHILIESLA